MWEIWANLLLTNLFTLPVTNLINPQQILTLPRVVVTRLMLYITTEES